MSKISGAKTKFLVYTGTGFSSSSTDTLAEFDALTANDFTEVGEITNFGDYGGEYTAITTNPVNADAVVKLKGQRDDGTLVLTVNLKPGDAGHALMEAAYEDTTNTQYVFKIEFNDRPGGTGAKPTRSYLVGKVMSWKFNSFTGNDVVSRTVSIALDLVRNGDAVAGS